MPIGRQLQWPVFKRGYECREEINPLNTIRLGAIPDRASRLWLALARSPTYGRGPLRVPCVCPKRHENERLADEDFVVYDPMTKFRLYKAFSRLKAKPAALVEFANKYGLLGLDGCGVTEPLERWYAEIAEMREAVTIHDLVCSDSVTDLAQRLGLPKGRRRKEVTVAARVTLITKVNKKLYGAASACLMIPDFLKFWDRYGLPAGLAYLPHTLLAAMWLQLALEVAQIRRVAFCHNCGKRFSLKPAHVQGRPRAQRSDTLYCSGACTTAACRKRKRAAQDDPQAAR